MSFRKLADLSPAQILISGRELTQRMSQKHSIQAVEGI